VALAVLCPRPVHAGTDEDPRAVEARRACAAGQVDRGIKLLADYLATTDDVTAVYNMGRCYEQNGVSDKALLQFREYLRKAPELSAADRAEVQAHIAQLQREQTPPPARITELAPERLPEPRAEDTRDERPALRKAGLSVAAVGVVAIAGGVYFGLHARSLEDRINSAPRYSPADYDGGRTSETLQFVMYGVGAAAVIGGVVLYLLGLPRHQLALAPSAAPGMVGAVARIGL
jgi:hypothetical protein